MLVTRRPFHSTPRGYKLFPTSCEMVRSLAVLIEKTSYELDDHAIRALGRLLDSIDDKKLDRDKGRWFGWNFEGASEQFRPSIWVTCVTVLSLDRLVGMLNNRINAIVLRHFDVIHPSKFRSEVDLNDLIYPDYGLALNCPTFEIAAFRDKRKSSALTLEEMRGHLMGVPLTALGVRATPFSAVLYGPPQTGKTTLAEALAQSSGVPLVRLSPFDLKQEPQESAESRGRVIFDALSMLTNAVILFDEFEPVLQGRSEPEQASGSASATSDQKAKAVSPSEFLFLLTGLLPKLVKLHNVARSQGLVYFLATNRIETIDAAAIRRGRFDLQVPVYDVDPLSRTAACLYRLQFFRDPAKDWPNERLARLTGEDRSVDAHAVIRVLTIVSATFHVPPSDLAQTFFPIPKKRQIYDLSKDIWKREMQYYAYIVEGYKEVDIPESSQPESTKDSDDDPKWKREQAWLNRFEHSFALALDDKSKKLAGVRDGAHGESPDKILEKCLHPPISG